MTIPLTTLILNTLILSTLSLMLTTPAVAGQDPTVGLRLPPALPCLPPPDIDALFSGNIDGPDWLAADELDDTGIIEPGAPSIQQLSAALGDLDRLLLRCIPDGQRVVAEVDLQLTVACSGQLSAAHLGNPDALPPAIARCVTQLLPYVAFPAHAVPEGYAFATRLEIDFP